MAIRACLRQVTVEAGMNCVQILIAIITSNILHYLPGRHMPIIIIIIIIIVSLLERHSTSAQQRLTYNIQQIKIKLIKNVKAVRGEYLSCSSSELEKAQALFLSSP